MGGSFWVASRLGEDMVSGRESYGDFESAAVPGYSGVAFPARLEVLRDRLIPACPGGVGVGFMVWVAESGGLVPACAGGCAGLDSAADYG